MADVAVLSPPGYSLDQVQRLFGYFKAVLEADLRPENLRLTPDVEELARKALLLPPDQRTLFQLVRNLRVGVYKARLIKVVEEAGSAVHAPLPSLDLGAYSPEFRSGGGPGEAPEGPVSGEVYFAPETSPAGTPGAESPRPTNSATMGDAAAPGAAATAAAQPRCVGCGGIASAVHSCGAPLCQHCIGSFPKCPKCGQPISTDNTHAAAGAVIHPTSSRPSGGGGLRGVFQRSKSSNSRAGEPVPGKKDHPATAARPGPERKPAPAASPGASTKDGPATTDSRPAPPKAVPEPPAPPATPVVKPRRDRADDEPRL